MNQRGRTRVKKVMAGIAMAVALAAMLETALVGTSQAAPAGDPVATMVLNGELRSTLVAAHGTHQVHGRVSGHLEASATALKQGTVTVRALNVVYFGVPQRAITGEEPRGKETGVLGFAIKGGDQGQVLRYDPAQKLLSGRVRGRVDLPQFGELANTQADSAEDSLPTPTPTQEATLAFTMRLEQPLRTSSQGIQALRGSIQTSLDAEELVDLRVASFRVASVSSYQGGST